MQRVVRRPPPCRGDDPEAMACVQGEFRVEGCVLRAQRELASDAYVCVAGRAVAQGISYSLKLTSAHAREHVHEDF